MSELVDNPLTLPAAGLVVAGLLGWAGYRWRQRRKNSSVDSSYLESKLQPDSFFGSSGGQSVDTAEAVATGSSMMYSPSQLDAGGDVDPVAEADVYLAYGRDLQAEEILKEALRINPKRVAIHAKMLEIYAKRRDAKAFEVLACEVYALTGGQGPEWEHACTLGQELDPPNPLYQPGGKPSSLEDAPTGFQPEPPGMANTQPFAPLDHTPAPESGSTEASHLDLDLDFSLDDAPPVEPTQEPTLEFDPAPPVAAEPPPAPAFELNADDLSLDLPSTPTEPVATSPAAEPAAEISLDDLSLDFDMPAEAPTPSPLEQTARIEPPAAAADDNLMAFNMDDLNLDVNPADSVSPLEDIPEGDPLETKLSLAAEFLAIGDMEGARSLAEEVQEQATGRLKDKATAFLSDLG